MADTVRRTKGYIKSVKDAYSMLVAFRRTLEGSCKYEYASEVEEIYKQLWCECLNEDAPWQ